MRVIRDRARRRLVLGFVAFTVAAVLAGCYPGDINSLRETDVVATIHDEGLDFQNKLTYALPDTVIDLSADPGAPSTLPDNIKNTILNAVHSNMRGLGYVEAEDPSEENPPDVVVLCSYTTKDFIYYYNYWCDYWGWYVYCDWGWYPGYDTVTYTAGMLVLNMFDIKDRPPDSDSYPMMWSALCSGILGSSPDAARISDAIDQAYDQSPYLKLQTTAKVR